MTGQTNLSWGTKHRRSGELKNYFLECVRLTHAFVVVSVSVFMLCIPFFNTKSEMLRTVKSSPITCPLDQDPYDHMSVLLYQGVR